MDGLDETFSRVSAIDLRPDGQAKPGTCSICRTPGEVCTFVLTVTYPGTGTGSSPRELCQRCFLQTAEMFKEVAVRQGRQRDVLVIESEEP